MRFFTISSILKYSEGRIGIRYAHKYNILLYVILSCVRVAVVERILFVRKFDRQRDDGSIIVMILYIYIICAYQYTVDTIYAHIHM
jgi:hypothetical protein